MSAECYAEEISANLVKAKQSIDAAENLLSDGYFDFSASRAYYAVFYSATALLLSENMEFSKHSGVIAAIHKHFVKAGKLDHQSGKDINWLFELRSIGDYGITIHVSDNEAREAITAASRFLLAARNILHEKLNGQSLP